MVVASSMQRVHICASLWHDAVLQVSRRLDFLRFFLNDSDAELQAMTRWVVNELGPDVPMHFSAFHPDYRMRDVVRTPLDTLRRARQIAVDAGVRYAYTGNVHDPVGDTTVCPGCGAAVIGRDWYTLTGWSLDPAGACRACGFVVAGVFDAEPGDWGRKRLPVHIGGGAR